MLLSLKSLHVVPAIRNSTQNNSFLKPQIPLSTKTKTEEIVFDKKLQTLERRNANYKPNIWDYDFLQSLQNTHDEKKYEEVAELLRKEVRSGIFVESRDDTLRKLECIDDIGKLCLRQYFEEDINKALDKIILDLNNNINKKKKNRVVVSSSMQDDDLYSTALCFRILRQYSYDVSPDVFLPFMNSNGEFVTAINFDAKTIHELFEASHLVTKGESILDMGNLMPALSHNNSLISPSHRRVNWFNVRRHIGALQKRNSDEKSVLLQLARLEFNRAQSQHQNELKEVLRWWTNLGIVEMSCARDRAVESFLFAMGIVCEPKYGACRKWLAKVIILILVVDDIYDIYGSLDELQHFINALHRWDPYEVKQLPEVMRRCFMALYNLINDIDFEIQKEKASNYSSVLPYLRKEWADFCEALLVEAKWYHRGHMPSLEEYLDNGWKSSSGPLLSIHVLLGVGDNTRDVDNTLKNCQEMVYCSSMILRLLNDLATSTAELERGDAASSILCYMREAKAGEEEAREYIRGMIADTWMKINSLSIGHGHYNLMKPFREHLINIARVSHLFYDGGDGFGSQDLDTRDQVISCLIEPLSYVL